MPPTNLFWRTFRPAEGFYTSEVQTPQRLPIRTFLPTGYEPNYAYPLLVFFHAHGGSDEQALRLAPRLSRRNYVCIGLRGPDVLGQRPDGRIGFGWGEPGQHDSLIEDYALNAIEQTRRNYHIHSERIYLAGLSEGASLAYRIGLTLPSRFGGIISLNGSMPRRNVPRLRLPEVRQLRIFIGHGIANAIIPLAMAREDYRLFYAAGMPVHMTTYPTNNRLHVNMLRDVNRWIIEKVDEELGTPELEE